MVHFFTIVYCIFSVSFISNSISILDVYAKNKETSCNIVISDPSLPTHPLPCLRGLITWKGTSSSVRLLFSPRGQGDLRYSRVCAYLSVSGTHSATLTHLVSGVQVSVSAVGRGATTRSKETCLPLVDSDGTPASVTLTRAPPPASAVAATTSSSGSSSSAITVEYVVESSAAQCTDKCSTKEVVDMICSSRLVISGTIEEITDNRVKIKVTALYRVTKDLVSSGIAYLYIKNCGVKDTNVPSLKLNTRYMFIGDTRLSLATLRCAVTMDTFISLWIRAVTDGANTCYL